MLSSIGVRCMHRRGVVGTGEARYAGNSASTSSTATFTIKHDMLHGKIVFMRGMPQGGGRKMFGVQSCRRCSRWGATRGSRGSIRLIT